MRQWAAYIMLAMAVAACSGGQDNEQQVADPDDAVVRGHEAAWTVAHTDRTDTIALQRAILDARATHDEYVLVGEEDAAHDFEQAFIDSLRRVDAQLAQEIFGNQ